jgi:23S rRNA pseudouridine1911/1915/1917 synthase
VTHYRVMQRLETAQGKFSLVEVKIDTGRTHQIRVHMASLGHPVVGDTTYGAPRDVLGRNFLHSERLEFAHPRGGDGIALKSELPAELREFLQKLEDAKVVRR